MGRLRPAMYLAPNTIVHRMDKTLPPELAVMFNPLGAGFRWAVEILRPRLATQSSFWGPVNAVWRV